jgi:hypothetical protein
LGPSIFSKFQLWSQIWQWNSINFVFKFQSYNLQLITFLKRYLASKSIHWNWRYHQFYVKKRVKSTKIYIAFSSNFTRFLTLNWRYLQFQWIDFDSRYRFGNVISCRLYDLNFTTKFIELRCQIGPQNWNLLKIGGPKMDFLE